MAISENTFYFADESQHRVVIPTLLKADQYNFLGSFCFELNFELHQAPQETQESSIILDLSVRKMRAEKSQDYRDYIVVKTFSVHTKRKSRCMFSNFPGLTSVEKLRFQEGIV